MKTLVVHHEQLDCLHWQVGCVGWLFLHTTQRGHLFSCKHIIYALKGQFTHIKKKNKTFATLTPIFTFIKRHTHEYLKAAGICFVSAVWSDGVVVKPQLGRANVPVQMYANTIGLLQK